MLKTHECKTIFLRFMTVNVQSLLCWNKNVFISTWCMRCFLVNHLFLQRWPVSVRHDIGMPRTPSSVRTTSKSFISTQKNVFYVTFWPLPSICAACFALNSLWHSLLLNLSWPHTVLTGHILFQTNRVFFVTTLRNLIFSNCKTLLAY